MELNFTIRSYFPETCLWGFNLEIRDGSNQSTNLLGEFCGDYGTGVVRSSGRCMWLKFIQTNFYNYISIFYIARSINETGMMFLSINYIYIYKYTRFQKHCNLKLRMIIYIPLFIHQKEKKIFIYIYIKYFQTCNVLCMYVSIYIYIYIYIYI